MVGVIGRSTSKCTIHVLAQEKNSFCAIRYSCHVCYFQTWMSKIRLPTHCVASRTFNRTHAAHAKVAPTPMVERSAISAMGFGVTLACTACVMLKVQLARRVHANICSCNPKSEQSSLRGHIFEKHISLWRHAHYRCCPT